MLFSDQVSILSNWFKNWNECEQTVALYSLLKKVQKSQAKFLARCLEHGLRDCHELGPIEEKANDADFISGLLLVSDQEKIISILLTHLPLLKPGNDFVKAQYLKLLPKVLEFSVERSLFLQECRQLLSYSLIHPAFDNDERTSLTSWMEHLDDRLVPENASKNGEEYEANKDVNGNQLWKDDPVLMSQSERSPVHWQPSEVNSNSSKLSLSPVHRRDETEFLNPADATKPFEETAVIEIDFNPWLKSLRLHKYTGFFNSMTYEEVMGLTEEKLSQQNVTKGARDKILLNVKKLHERFDRLQALEKEIGGGGSIRNALNELKNMICTPIVPFESSPQSLVDPEDPTPAEAVNMTPSLVVSAAKNEAKPGDIPAQFTKVLGKACTQLLISRPDKDNISVYMSLLEKCMQHQAFTPQQNKRLSTWKTQISKFQRTLPRNQQMSSQRSSVGSAYPNRRVTGRSLPSFGARVTSPAASPSPMSSASVSMVPAGLVKSNWYGSGYSTQPTPNTVQPPIDVARKTASLDPSFVRRTAGFLPLQNNDLNQSRGACQVEQDITRRLDSLRMSVTDQPPPGHR